MIKQAYINGFMNKCAEYGVDGRVFLEKQAIPLRTMKSVASKLLKGKARLHTSQLPGGGPYRGVHYRNYHPTGWGENLTGDKNSVTEWIRALVSKNGNTGLTQTDAKKLKTLFAPADPIQSNFDQLLKLTGDRPFTANKYSDRIRALLSLYGEGGRADSPLRFATDIASAKSVGDATRRIAGRSKFEQSVLGQGHDAAKTLIDGLNRGFN